MSGADPLLAPAGYGAARIEAERLAIAFVRLKDIAFFQIAVAALIAFAIAGRGAGADLLVWVTGVVAVAGLRLLLIHLHRRSARAAEQNRFWAAASGATALLSGCAWGLGPVLLLSDQPFDHWLWSMAIGGMSAGSAALMGIFLPAALGFIYPACLLFMTGMFLNGMEDRLIVGLLTVAFMAVMTTIAVQFSRQFGDTQALRFALEQQAEELNRFNQQLSHEIEEHRKTAESLFQSQKMEALGKVTGGIAHDFNNLLTVILISLQSILKNSEDGKVRSCATMALEAANGGANLTAELLSFSRQEALQPVVADLNRLIEQFRPLLAQSAERRATLDIDLSGKAMVVIDVARFQSAMINLVINARDAMDKPGRITIRTSLALLDESEGGLTDHGPGTFVRIDVADTGAGMPPEVASRAFEPFFTTKGVGKGTGLGLAQVYSFARQAGGTAKISSVPGEGTCITLFIPATEVTIEATGSDADMRIASGAGKRALLVDDNTAILMMLRSTLIDEGWEVRFAQEALTALHLLERGENIDVLITDIDMPGGLSGFDLARTARARWPHIGVLLISGSSINSEELCPGVQFLAKPFRPHQFMNAIAACLPNAPTPKPELRIL